jgi:hypothetical protein
MLSVEKSKAKFTPGYDYKQEHDVDTEDTETDMNTELVTDVT